jgi:hypothetical protein
MKKSKATVTLVANKGSYYPYEDQDYDKLAEIKAHLLVIDEDFLPLLKSKAKLHNLHLTFVSFEELESAMHDKVRAKWPFEFETLKSDLHLKMPKSVDDSKMEKLVAALQTWYSRHRIKLELITKRTSKSTKVILRKSYAED